MAVEKWLNGIQAGLQASGITLPESGPGESEAPLSWARRHQVPEELIAKMSAEALGIAYADSLAELRPAATYLQNFPIGFSRLHSSLALVDTADTLKLAMAGPQTWPVLDIVARVLGRHPMPVFAPQAELLRAINAAYEQHAGQAHAVLEAISHDGARAKLQEFEQRPDLLSTDRQAPVIELVNLILLDAVKGAASDVHFQPYRENIIVRYRIDGVLFDAYTLPKDVQEEVLSRVKVMGKMNIAEKRLPQDGRATVTVGDRIIDLRIASLPGSHGERIVLRLLDKSTRIYTLSEIGMSPENHQGFRQLIDLEHGLILLTGPTGSGKTTTLYAALKEINTRDRNVVTLEDPIEYDIEGISQTQINVKKGLTFATGLRNVLRQDPDIIMVGEIRDQETAVMAIQSALTGHLVFSTLHTNDAASAVTRLLDLGIEPYLVSSSLLAVLAQRLVRQVCADCGTSEPVTADDLTKLALSPEELGVEMIRRGQGCEKCRQTGYRGRVAISELLVVDDAIRTKIQERASATEIRDVATSRGMRLLRDDGLIKVRNGTTTPSEVARVTVRTRL